MNLRFYKGFEEYSDETLKIVEIFMTVAGTYNHVWTESELAYYIEPIIKKLKGKVA